MQDKWMNIGYENDELKPHIEPKPDLDDQRRLGNDYACYLFYCAIFKDENHFPKGNVNFSLFKIDEIWGWVGGWVCLGWGESENLEFRNWGLPYYI